MGIVIFPRSLVLGLDVRPAETFIGGSRYVSVILPRRLQEWSEREKTNHFYCYCEDGADSGRFFVQLLYVLLSVFVLITAYVLPSERVLLEFVRAS